MNQFDPVDILIVEDNPHDAELIVRTLQKQKLANNIFVAEDGAEALDFIFCRGIHSNRDKFKPPKVIFLDLKLPKVNGLEVLKEIKSNAETKKLPVVIITSSKEDPDITKAYELGANSYVVKPVDFVEFVHAFSSTGVYWLLVNEAPR
ncbi:MAG: response regulator [Bacteroidetes bacterium]|nr:response regulator [Bacteroidota bacterium]